MNKKRPEVLISDLYFLPTFQVGKISMDAHWQAVTAASSLIS